MIEEELVWVNAI